MEKIKIELKWAFIFVAVGLLWITLEKWVGLHDTYLDYQYYLTNLFAIPAITMMVLALKDKRRNYYGGQITYLQGLESGVILSVFIALLSPVSQWITSYVITPDYFPNVIKRSVEIGFFKTTAEAEAHFNYLNYAKNGAIWAIVSGIITTAIAMIFLKNKK